MDIDALRAFLAVSENKSFSLAAQSLHLTQPAISKRIAALEAQLEHALFDRLGREVVLTQAGETLLPRARSIVQDVYETERSVRELSGEVNGSLSVATSHHIGLHHLPPILRRFVNLHANVNLQFQFLDSEQAHKKVELGECELALVTLAPKIQSPLLATELWPDPLDFVVGRHHPLAKRKGEISLLDLSLEPAILPDLNTFTGRLIKALFDRQHLRLQLNMATNYLETIKMMVSVGIGWSVLPRTMLDKHMKSLVVQEPQLQRSLGVIINERRSLGNAAKAFYDVLRDKDWLSR